MKNTKLITIGAVCFFFASCTQLQKEHFRNTLAKEIVPIVIKGLTKPLNQK